MLLFVCRCNASWSVWYQVPWRHYTPLSCRSGAASANGPSQYKYYFNIGSVDSFERQLEEAQETLGWNPDEFIPITYTSQVSWSSELLRLAPTILLIAGYVWFTRRSMGGGMGGMGGGSRSLFNVGKAHIAVIDKNAKNKTMFKVGRGGLPFELWAWLGRSAGKVPQSLACKARKALVCAVA